MPKRSDLMTRGPQRSPHRSLLKADGFDQWELERPIIGIANSFNEIIPGHMHLDKLVDAVKAGVYAAGGTRNADCSSKVEYSFYFSFRRPHDCRQSHWK